MIKKLHTLLFVLFFLQFLSSNKVNAQTIFAQVDINNEYMSNTGDCVSWADPRWQHAAGWNGNAYYNPVGTWAQDDRPDYYGGLGYGSFMNTGGIPANATLSMFIASWEEDGVVCGGTDGDCSAYWHLAWNDYFVNYTVGCGGAWAGAGFWSNAVNCGDGIDWKVQFSFRYYWEGGSLSNANAGGTISATSATTICAGSAVSFSGDNPLYGRYSYVSWQRDGADQPSGGTYNSFNSGALAAGTYTFRRRLGYCSDFGGGVTYVYSNNIVVTVQSTVNNVGVITAPTSICIGSAAAISNVTAASTGSPASSGPQYYYYWQRTSAPVVGWTMYDGPTANLSSNLPTAVTNTAGTYLLARNSQFGCTGQSSAPFLNLTVTPLSVIGTPSVAQVNFCDAGGNFSAAGAVTLSGYVGTPNVEWGSSDGNWNAWLSNTATSGTATFPKKVAAVDGNADRIRFRVQSGNCPSVYSPTILINNHYNPAPLSLALNLNNQCPGASGIVLTATFATAINLNGTVEFYSGACGLPGGTLVASLAGNGLSTISTPAFNAPASTTTYYVRYNPGTGTGCTPTACVSTTLNIQAITLPTLNTATPASGTSICQGLSVKAAIFSGLGGTGSSDTYEFSTDGGSTWSSYVSNALINTSAATGSVQVRVSRSAGTGSGCTAVGPSVIASWPVFAQPSLPTLNTAIPADGTSICQGQAVSASINAGSGGTGASDTYQYSTDGGSTWNTYSSGTNINTSTATGSVKVRVSRSAGTGTFCSAVGPVIIATWPVFVQPIIPTLNTATPATGTNICQGQTVKATINAGSGGTGAADVYEFSTDGGSTWNSYSSGTNINTSTATGSVKVRISRNAGTGTGCNIAGPVVVATWPVYVQPILPTLNTATPASGTNICLGQTVNATINAGSGGIGATDTYEFSTNGGTSWNSYTSGTNINTATATTSVQVRVSRSTGTGLGCSAVGPSVISTWPIDLPPTATPTYQLYTCDATANLTATGVTSGATVDWQYVSGPVNPTGTTTSNPLLVTYSSAGTGKYNLLVSKGACNNINVGNVTMVMPTTLPTTIATTASCGYCVIKDGNTRTFYNSAGQLIAKIEDDPTVTPAQLDETEVCVRMDGAVQTVLDNYGNLQPYLQRQWTVHPANNTSSFVTLYFTNSELTALQTAASSSVYQFSGYSSLSVTKYPGGSNGSFTAPAALNGESVPYAFSAYGGNHKVDMTVSTFSTFYIHPVLYPNAPLPVELTSFTGWNQGSVNRLQWITASEQNTSKYEIEKSTYPGTWVNIGVNPAAGNSNQVLTYNFTDNNPAIGNNYYRLKVIDIDGTYSYTNVVNIPIAEAVANNFNGVYPNPTNGQLNVEIQSTDNYDTRLLVYDVVGKKVFDKSSSLLKGLNTLHLDFSTLAKGTYVLQFVDKDAKTHTTKFVKD